MSKITLNNVGSLLDATTAATTINNNSAAIVTAWDNTLSRDGTAPNQMEADLDMNSHDILNVNEIRLTDGTTLTQLPTSTVEGSLIYRGETDWTTLPPGTDGQFLRTHGLSAAPTWDTATGLGDMFKATYDPTNVAADAFDSENHAFLQSGTGAQARSVQDKLRDTVSVKDFGLVGDDLTDNVTAFDAALTAASAGSFNLYFPPGVYRTSGAHVIPANVSLFGAGKYITTIKTTSATNNLLSTVGTGNTIRSLGFASSVARTAGAFVVINSGLFEIDDFVMNGAFQGITCQSPQRTILIHNGEITDTVVGGEGAKFVNTGTDVTMNDMVFTINNLGARPNAHIALYVLGDLSMSDIQMFGAVNNMTITPNAGQGISSLKCVNVWFDQAQNNGLFIQPSVDGSFKRSSFIGCWFAGSGTGSGVVMFPNGASTSIDGIDFNGCEFLQNGTSGLFTGGTVGTISNIQVVGGRVAGNASQGILFDGVIGGQIQNVRIGPAGGYGGANGTGVQLAAAADFINVSGNDIRGNTIAITYGASGTSNRITDNIGFNPVGGDSIVVGASPFTYTAGPWNESVYVLGGTLSAIDTAGRTIATSSSNSATTVQLGPNESVTVTYSSAPFMNKSIH